ncbi:GGDEF domain-containing protein [Paenibacillus hamazuiensis]|uniref:GGDEF domain-containing protein n=1 Tax=Paenibacillus hamazuiensis TaxID=2936508 RepID=UPI00200D7DBA|nr:GGDEF domain-containing protein [Paenibacillus hamazuiensis]
MIWTLLIKDSAAAVSVLVAISYGIRQVCQNRGWSRGDALPVKIGLGLAAVAAGLAAACIMYGSAFSRLVHIAYVPLIALAFMRQPAVSVVAAGMAIGAGEAAIRGAAPDGQQLLVQLFALILYARVASYLRPGKLRFPASAHTAVLHIALFVPSLYVWQGMAGSPSSFMLAQAVSLLGCCTAAAFIRSMQKEQARSRLLAEEASKDHLTQLYNMRFFEVAFDRYTETAAQLGRPLSLAFIDIDYFKNINDAHGHQSGDAVLRELSVRIRSQLRSEDVAARYGGEEFVVLLPGCGPEQAVQAAERIRKRVEGEPFTVGGNAVPVTVSIGVSSFPLWPGGQLVAAADAALYQAKRKGRNRVEPAFNRQ